MRIKRLDISPRALRYGVVMHSELPITCRLWRALRYSRVALRLFPVSLFHARTRELIRVRRLRGELAWERPPRIRR